MLVKELRKALYDYEDNSLIKCVLMDEDGLPVVSEVSGILGGNIDNKSKLIIISKKKGETNE